MHHAVIIGGGFGGVQTAKLLLKKGVKVTLINKQKHFLFTPLLHEVATGSLCWPTISGEISSIIKHPEFSFMEGEVTGINTKKQVVKASEWDVPYDSLILAIGAKPAFYKVKGAREHALTLKSVEDAIKIYERLKSLVQEAKTASDKERKRLLSLTFVGAGATGVELASEVSQYVKRKVGRKYRDDVTITLLHAQKNILEHTPSYIQKRTEQRLEKLGITLHKNFSVKEVKPGIVKGPKNIKSNLIFWCAGVQANTIPLNKKTTAGYEVDEFLAVKGQKNVFALGDCAKGIPPYPKLAQIAEKQASIVAANVLGEQRPFTPHLQGFLLSVGQGYAVAQLSKYYFAGLIAWGLWKFVYLAKLPSMSQRFKLIGDWTTQGLKRYFSKK